ncbi:hypothetical protein AO262_24355 [Pseudomonas fluorescens ABAC62]|nr:hypothetical protein AO262_24355 [Pseudomonas fluorescens ABAC62]
MKLISVVLRTLCALLVYLPVTASVAQAEPDVKLLVRTSLMAAHGTFDAKTQAWLDGRQYIRVAFWGGAQPPLHIGYDPYGFEGITADVLGVLQQMLGVPMRMRRFADRDAAEQAMARGDIDLLAINVITEPESPLFKPSIAYLLNNKVTVRRAGDSLKPNADLSGERVAYIATTPEHLQRIKDQYPNSQLIPYVNHMNALAGLAYDQVDAFRTNAVTAQYLLSSFQRNNLYIAEDGGATRAADINFAVNSQYPLLLSAINQSLAQIPVADMLRITSNWGLGTNFVVADKSFEMTPAQSAWVAEHRTLKVIVVDSYAPLTFLDDRNRLNGLSADMLRQIERITGLKFEVIFSKSIADMVEKLQSGEVDVIAALGTGSSRLQASQYTRPYLVSPYVVVTRAESAIHSLNDLDGLHVALPWGNPLADVIKKDFPRVTVVEVRNATEGLEKLAAGEVQATVQTQYIADYFISHHFQADLHIASVIGPRPARVAMVVSPGNDVLKSILNGALLQIRPDESRALTDRWGVHEPPAVASSWRTYKDVVYTVIAAAILFALVFLVWNHALRSNIQKRQKAERDLEDQLQFTRTLVDGSPVALYVRDQQGRLAQCNQAYLDFFGGERETLLGKNLIESQVFNEEFSSRYHEMYLQTLREQRPVFADIDVELNGETLRVYHWVLPFHNAGGQYIGVIGGWLDVTEREHLTEQLRLANEKAVSANHSKSVFLASMSHEIRTPVSALVGLIELLRLKGPDAHTQEDLETAHQTSAYPPGRSGPVDLSVVQTQRR